MASFLYDINSVLIVFVLFVVLVVTIEAGYKLGKRKQTTTTKRTKTQIGAIQASMLGMLALLLGFSFSQSLERFDARSEAVVDEANAIGTAYLRTDTVPSIRERTQVLLQEYLNLRIQAAGMSVDTPEEELRLKKAEQKQSELWRYSTEATEDRDNVTALFIESLNELIDSYGRRKAQVSRHVPEEVMLLLMITIVLTGFVVGVSSGVDGHRPSSTAYAMVILIVLLVFMIIDLDRPRRGLIKVHHNSLIELLATIQAGKDA